MDPKTIGELTAQAVLIFAFLTILHHLLKVNTQSMKDIATAQKESTGEILAELKESRDEYRTRAENHDEAITKLASAIDRRTDQEMRGKLFQGEKEKGI